MYFTTALRSLCFLFTAVQCMSWIHSIKLCGCKSSDCAIFEFGKCAPFYSGFKEYNGILFYIKPLLISTTNNGVVNGVHVPMYSDTICQDELHYASWIGDCDDACWKEDFSGIGAQGCTSSGLKSKPAVLVIAIVGVVSMLFVWEYGLLYLYGRFVTAALWVIQYWRTCLISRRIGSSTSSWIFHLPTNMNWYFGHSLCSSIIVKLYSRTRSL